MTALSTAAAPRGTMTLRAHGTELRRRAVRAAVALAIGVVAGFALAPAILDVLRTPIETLAAERTASLNYDSLTGAFELTCSIALISGVLLSSPVWLFELLRFIAPGLTRREKRIGFIYLGIVIALFGAGAYCGFTIFPRVVDVLAGFASEQDSTILSASFYVGFVTKLIVATGVAFALPAFLVMLNALGVVSAAALRSQWRLVVVAIVVFSALVTPAADVLSMFLIAIPMAALYATALLIATLHDRRAARRGVTAARKGEPAACSD